MLKSKLFWIITSVLILGVGGYVGYKMMSDNSALATYLPKNSAIVFSADFKSLASKMNFTKLKNLSFFNKMKELSQTAGEKGKFASKYADDPFATGVSFLKDAYCFAYSNNGSPCGGAVFGISAKNKFDEFMKQVPDLKNPVVINAKYNYVFLEREIMLIWNDEVGILLAGINEDKKDDGIKLIQKDEKNSIVSLEAFRNYQKKSADIGMFINFNELKSFYGPYGNVLTGEINFKDTYADIMLNFEKNQIVVASEMSAPEDVLAKNNTMNSSGISNEMQSLLTNKKPLFLMSMSFNMKKIVELINKQSMYNDLIKSMSENLNISKTDIEGFLGGEFSFSLSDITTKKVNVTEYNYETDEEYETEKDVEVPSMVLSLSVKNNNLTSKLLTQMQAKNENGYWVFPIPSETFGSNLFIVETDNAVTLTNDDNAANELVSQIGRAHV